MESAPRRSGKWIKGFKKNPTYEDILGVELANTHKYLSLPQRFYFLAPHAATGASELEKKLTDHKERLLRSHQGDLDDRMGDTPVVINRIRGEQGVRGEQGMTGAQGVRGEQGAQGAQGPPGASVDMNPVLQVMQSRLQEMEATRERARNQEVQDELALMRIEAQRHAETSRVLAQAAADLTSIPNELRAIARATVPQIPAVDYMRQAQDHLARQTAHNQEATIQFLQRHTHDAAQMMGQAGLHISQLIDKFKPPDRDIIMTTPQPPPPPPPAAGRVKRAAKVIEDRRGVPPQPSPPTGPRPNLPPTPPPPPQGIMPGSSTDRPRGGTFDFGGPGTGRHSSYSLVKKPEQFYIGDPTPALAKEKKKKEPPAGLAPQTTVPDHQTKLTKKGPKPILEDPPKKTPKPRMVPSVIDQELKKLDRGAARYDRAQAAKRKRDELGPALKRQRRVSAHAI